MSIRQRLATFIWVMTGLLFCLAGIMLFGGPRIIQAYAHSLDTMNELAAVRALRIELTKEKESVGRYFLLGDAQEIIAYEEAEASAKRRLETLRRYGRRGDGDWYEALGRAIETVHMKAGIAIDHFRKGHSHIVLDDSGALFSQYQSLLRTVGELERKMEAASRESYDGTRSLITRFAQAVFVTIFGVILLGLAMFRRLYGAVMTPLRRLTAGTEAFGGGDWEHRIELSEKTEFSALADSFNQMAENVRQLQMQAIHMDRMSSVGQLAGGVAHEINNPLTAVLGHAQILLSRLPEGDPSYASIQKIEQAALRCRKIVRGLLDFSRPAQTTFETVRINDVLSGTLELCEADLKKNRVVVERRMAEGLPDIMACSSELQQVFLNLFTNSLQAMPQGGSLVVTTRHRTDPIILRGRRAGDETRRIEGPFVEVEVRDTGVGIAPDHLGRVFQPFFTTKEIGKGTGLGLAVSLGIVQKHGGDIRVESEGPGHGCRFVITLPLNPAVPSGLPAGSSREEAA